MVEVEDDESIAVKLEVVGEVVGVGTETETQSNSDSMGSNYNIFISTPNEIPSTSGASKSTTSRRRQTALPFHFCSSHGSASTPPEAKINSNLSTGSSIVQQADTLESSQ